MEHSSLDLQLQPDEVHVWRVPLVVPETLFQQLSQLLSEQEVTKAGLFRFMRDRRRWIIAHGFLRLLLSRYLLIDADLLHFDVNAYGKPFLVSPVQSTSLQFNVSHSHELALYAFSYSRQVGIDVEYKRANVDYEGVARISFSQDEQARLRSLPDELKQEAFYNCWARKEAYIKARGKGMSIDLAQFDVSFLPGEPAVLLEDREEPGEMGRWRFREIAVGDEYAAAVVVEGSGWELRCWPVDGNVFTL